MSYDMFDDTKRDLMGLTARDRARAYTATKMRFGLRAAQRDKLDHSTVYSLIMLYAHSEHWDHVNTLLSGEGII